VLMICPSRGLSSTLSFPGGGNQVKYAPAVSRDLQETGL
jgi:hypothetical protein